MIGQAVEVLVNERGEGHFATLIARSYAAVLEHSASEADALKRQALADRLETELTWQPSAVTMANWLRSKPQRTDWQQLPVVF